MKMELEVGHGPEDFKPIKERGVAYAQAARDLGVHLCAAQLAQGFWKPILQHSFPGHGQMKPEPLEIAQLKREVTRWSDRRDHSSPWNS
jgi:hypothetical protein